jgi:polyhydroxybutyrate depolymerase
MPLRASLILLLGCFCCGTTSGQLQRNFSFLTAESTRNYHVYVPVEKKNAALVILLHGNGGGADQLLGFEKNLAAPSKRWLQLAEKEQFILVVPDGSIAKNGARGWNDCRRNAIITPLTNDVAFISALIDTMIERYGADPKRVFVCGISNGGLMANRLVQEIPERITAFASIIAAMPAMSECVNSDVPVSALFMNGTADPIMPYEGGEIGDKRGLALSTDSCINYWKERNGAFTLVNSLTFIPQSSQRAVKYSKQNPQRVDAMLYQNSSSGYEVMLYRVVGGGHTEPSVCCPYRKSFIRFTGPQNRLIEYADVVWEFFEKKRR